MGKLDTVEVNGPEGDVVDWDAVDWRAVEDDVRRLRHRIFTEGLLEPGASKRRTPGSEGAAAQQCAAATRLEARSTTCWSPRGSTAPRSRPVRVDRISRSGIAPRVDVRPTANCLGARRPSARRRRAMPPDVDLQSVPFRPSTFSSANRPAIPARRQRHCSCQSR